MMKIFSLLLLLALLLPNGGAVASVDCQTFSSLGNSSIQLDRSLAGYYVIAFGAKDYPPDDQLSVFWTYERGQYLIYGHGDLPAPLPGQTDSDFNLTLNGKSSSSDFWVTLARTPDGCTGTSVPNVQTAPSPTAAPTQSPTALPTSSPTASPTATSTHHSPGTFTPALRVGQAPIAE